MTEGPAGSVPAAELARSAVRAMRGDAPTVGVVVIAAEEPADSGAEWVGRRMLVEADGCRGSLGDAELDRKAMALARTMLVGKGGTGAREVTVAGTMYTLYFEPFRPPPELLIVGAGHIARPLCRIGAMLGFRVTVLDDRPEFATRERFPEAERVIRADFADPFRDTPLGSQSHLVLVTRGHRYDYDALRDALRRPVELPYVGMVGSRRRVRAALEQLAQDGIPPDRLHEIHTPIGLDIGAETPAEIAVAIAAEIVRARRGRTGVSLRERERVVERWGIGTKNEK